MMAAVTDAGEFLRRQGLSWDEELWLAVGEYAAQRVDDFAAKLRRR
jgi:hypothetical protein